MQRKSVNTDIQEAADHDSKYEDYDVRNRIEEKKHREFLSGVECLVDYFTPMYAFNPSGEYVTVIFPSAVTLISALILLSAHFLDFNFLLV